MSSNRSAKRSRQPSVLLAILVGAALVLAVLWMTLRRGTAPVNQSEDNQTGQVAAASADSLHGDIYPDGARAAGDLANALKQAAREHKRVILDFGGNWCGDCHVLDIYFHDAANLPLLNANYVLVDINIGQYDENLDLAAKYGVPLQKGVPALVVLSSDGQVLYSQRHGEFDAMRTMASSSVTSFLEKWKG